MSRLFDAMTIADYAAIGALIALAVVGFAYTKKITEASTTTPSTNDKPKDQPLSSLPDAAFKSSRRTQ